MLDEADGIVNPQPKDAEVVRTLAPAPVLAVDFQDIAFLIVVEPLKDHATFRTCVHLVNFLSEMS